MQIRTYYSTYTKRSDGKVWIPTNVETPLQYLGRYLFTCAVHNDTLEYNRNECTNRKQNIKANSMDCVNNERG